MLKLGNFVAAEAAKASLKKEVPEMVDLAQQIATHNKRMLGDVVCVYKYIVAYNKKTQSHAGLDASQQAVSQHESHTNDRTRHKISYKIVLANWTVPSAVPSPTQLMDMETAQCCSWGSKIAYHVYSWIQTIRWPDNMDLRPHDHGIAYIELLANFQLVTGASIPITVSRNGTVVFWEEFLSPKALILPKRSRPAIAQSVVLESIVHQLEQALSTKFFPIQRIGIKTLSRLGHCDLQKRTGFVRRRRPQLLFQEEMVTVVDAYPTECRNQNNFNLPLLTNRYIHELPRPIDSNLPNQFVDKQTGAVPYHRKKLKKTQKETEMVVEHLNQLPFFSWDLVQRIRLPLHHRGSCVDLNVPCGVLAPPKLLGKDAMGK